MRQLDAAQRLPRQMQRVMRIIALFLHRQRRFDHGALFLRSVEIDRLGEQIGFNRCARLFPIALHGVMFVIFSIAIAAAEAAVGLALIITIYRHFKTTNVDKVEDLKG